MNKVTTAMKIEAMAIALVLLMAAGSALAGGYRIISDTYTNTVTYTNRSGAYGIAAVDTFSAVGTNVHATTIQLSNYSGATNLLATVTNTAGVFSPQYSAGDTPRAIRKTGKLIFSCDNATVTSRYIIYLKP